MYFGNGTDPESKIRKGKHFQIHKIRNRVGLAGDSNPL